MKDTDYRVDIYKCDICGNEYDVLFKGLSASSWKKEMFLWSWPICSTCGMFGNEHLRVREGKVADMDGYFIVNTERKA